MYVTLDWVPTSFPQKLIQKRFKEDYGEILKIFHKQDRKGLFSETKKHSVRVKSQLTNNYTFLQLYIHKFYFTESKHMKRPIFFQKKISNFL